MANQTYGILTYEQALNLVKPHISKLISSRKLKAFCEEHKLHYRVVVMLGSDTTKREFPDALHQLLELFDYKTERVKAFKVFNLEKN